MKKTHAAAGVAALSFALLVSGCGSSGSSGSSAPSTASTPSATPTPTASATPGSSSAPAAAATITIKSYGYTVPATVKAGAMVMIKNEDPVAHTVTADSSGGFDVTVPGNGTAMLTAPSKAGSYKFHCTYHSNMHGTLKVG